MVTKGVLKEHLILLANSMTCAGNLVGFNSGGYKTLSRSLDIQVPFTEATLFTPRKCFERAAEKCHVDTLSSVVTSCSWGKYVAVGTGSRFDVLWDQKEVGLNQEGSIDVYEFLNMVRADANGEESVTACLGAEVDDLMLDEEIDDWNLSPEHNFGSDKPMFEDGGWDSVAAPLIELDKEASSPGWVLPNAGGNDGRETQLEWEKSKSPEASHGWGLSKVVSDDSEKEKQWGKPKSCKVSQGWCSPKESINAASSQWNSRGSDGIERQLPWHKPKPLEASCGWGSLEAVNDDSEGKQQWGKPKSSEVSQGWCSPKDSGKPESSQWGGEPRGKHKAFKASHGWGSSEAVKDDSELQQQWGKPKSSELSQGWCSLKDSGKPESSQWGGEPWGKPKASKTSHGWGSSEAVNDDSEVQQQWVKPKSSKVSQGWCLPKDSVEPESSQWGSNANERRQSLQGWGAPKESGDAVSSKGWGLLNAGANNEIESQQWGEQSKEFKKNRREGLRGWGTNNGEWKGKSRPTKSQGSFNLDSGVGAMFTATRQRLDIFTSEEQDILSDVEPLMRSIRRIMHQSGYNDGDALSAADQSYILDNVFNHHPDKVAKMGANIDHVMVSKHIIFAESRCFYVVSSDGCKHDFSYRKCLENLVKSKYPDLATEFIEKYFTKPRSKGKQQQNSDVEKSGKDSQLRNSTAEETGADNQIGNEN